jgi:hypothetical protein
MIKKLIPLAASIMFILPISISYADCGPQTIMSQAGDNDNLGRISGCACWDVTHEPDDGVFDLWSVEDKVWTHTFEPLIDKKITSATLSIYGFNIEDGTLKLFVDGVEIPGAFANVHEPTTSKTVINLDPSIYDKLKSGSVEVAVRQGSNNPSTYDAFAIDYATLQIQYTCDTIPVSIDIKPGSYPSSFGAQSNGSIPVALFGSPTFDVTQVDDTTVRFGDSEKSGATASKVGLQDVNGDGIVDKVYHFPFQETNLDPSDTKGYLSGTINGENFLGSDSVNIVGGK